MNRGRDDDADPERGEADNDRQGGVLFFHQLPPEMVGSDLVDDHEDRDEEDDAEQREEDRSWR